MVESFDREMLCNGREKRLQIVTREATAAPSNHWPVPRSDRAHPDRDGRRTSPWSGRAIAGPGSRLVFAASTLSRMISERARADASPGSRSRAPSRTTALSGTGSKSLDAAGQLHPTLAGRRSERHPIEETARRGLRRIEIAVRIDPDHPGARAKTRDNADRGETIPGKDDGKSPCRPRGVAPALATARISSKLVWTSARQFLEAGSITSESTRCP